MFRPCFNSVSRMMWLCRDLVWIVFDVCLLYDWNIIDPCFRWHLSSLDESEGFLMCLCNRHLLIWFVFGYWWWWRWRWRPPTKTKPPKTVPNTATDTPQHTSLETKQTTRNQFIGPKTKSSKQHLWSQNINLPTYEQPMAVWVVWLYTNWFRSCCLWNQSVGFELCVLGTNIWFRCGCQVCCRVCLVLAPKIWVLGFVCSNTDVCQFTCSFLWTHCATSWRIDVTHCTHAYASSTQHSHRRYFTAAPAGPPLTSRWRNSYAHNDACYD